MGIADWYREIIQSEPDPRTKEWFMVGGPGPLVMIITTYLYFCLSAGPRYMRDKKPYTLKKTLMIYNLSQVILSIILVYEGVMAGWLNGYSIGCEPVNRSMDPKPIRMARAVWLYYMCKLIELLDTVFFVLRKKQRQISFLHVYHHALMPVAGWIGTRYWPGGQGTLLGFINSFIHILMYSYYMLSAAGPSIQKYLWWKKYLTSLQLVQFVIIFFQNLYVINTDCNFPKFITLLLLVNAFFFIYLFGSFYVRTYLKSISASNTTKKINNTDDDNNRAVVANGVKTD